MSKKVAVLIDLANISSAFEIIKRAKKLPFATKIDYNRLVTAVTLGDEIISKSIYTGSKKTVDQRAQQGFFDYFKKNGFNVVTKECKIIRLEGGAEKVKANFDVEITYDACSHIWKRECAEIILVSGDSDFEYLINKAKELDFKITVVSSNATLSRELRTGADRVILLDDFDLNYYSFENDKKKAA